MRSNSIDPSKRELDLKANVVLLLHMDMRGNEARSRGCSVGIVVALVRAPMYRCCAVICTTAVEGKKREK